jgi:hypothetical protein
MLLTYARAFATCAASVEYARGQLAVLMAQGFTGPVSEHEGILRSVHGSLDVLKELCERIPALEKVVLQIDRAKINLDSGDGPMLVFQELAQLQHRLFDELQDHYYYPITKDYALTYYNETPWGDEVYNSFPTARLDLQNAGRCIVLGQGTAGVFHLMRVMEVALRALGNKLNVAYSPSWNTYLQKIQNEVNRKHLEKSTKWKKNEPLYKDIIGDLTAIKVAWRNTTMHIDQEYDPGSATNIYRAVGVFLDRLAKAGIKEKGRATPPVVGLSEATA